MSIQVTSIDIIHRLWRCCRDCETGARTSSSISNSSSTLEYNKQMTFINAQFTSKIVYLFQLSVIQKLANYINTLNYININTKFSKFTNKIHKNEKKIWLNIASESIHRSLWTVETPHFSHEELLYFSYIFICNQFNLRSFLFTMMFLKTLKFYWFNIMY